MAAAVLALALIVIRQVNVGIPEATPVPSPTPTAATPAQQPTPVPISELPSGGQLDATLPIEGFQILTLAAFDQVWLTEHHFIDYGLSVDPASLAAAAASRTRRIRIGLAAAILPFHHPLRLAEQVAKGLGFKVKEKSTGGGSDGNFTSALGVPTLDGLGGVGEGAHALHEHIVLAEIPRRTALLAGLLAEAERG